MLRQVTDKSHGAAAAKTARMLEMLYKAGFNKHELEEIKKLWAPA